MAAPASPTNIKTITATTAAALDTAVNAFIAATANIFVFEVQVNGINNGIQGQIMAVISYGISA